MENKNPLVSVVVPSYNHEKYITEAIESVFNSDYKKEALKYIWTAIKNPLRSRSIKGFGKFLS